MQIRLHELKHQVQIFLILGLNYFVKLDDILMVKLFEYGHFSISPLGVDRIAKCVEHLFKGITFVGSLLLYLPNMAICPASHLLL